jgi:transcriptional regulator with XRE-family HTH domain
MMERIRALREDKDLKQWQLAEYLQVSQSSYSDYEHGNANIPIAILKKLALFFGTSIDYMLELTDDPRPYPRRRRK